MAIEVPQVAAIFESRAFAKERCYRNQRMLWIIKLSGGIRVLIEIPRVIESIMSGQNECHYRVRVRGDTVTVPLSDFHVPPSTALCVQQYQSLAKAR
jgi:hypothetical protein